MEIKKKIFFDFEVIKNEWMVGFLFENGEVVKIRNNTEKLKTFISNLETLTVLIGYNNTSYDNHVMGCIFSGINPSVVNFVLIENKLSANNIKYDRNWKPENIVLFDCFSSSNNNSLKTTEAFFGDKIDIEDNFNIDNWNNEEYKRICEYNKSDLFATKKVFEAEENGFYKPYQTKINLCEMFDKPKSLINLTLQQLGGKILNCEKFLQKQSFFYKCPKCIEVEEELKKKFESFKFEKDGEKLNFIFNNHHYGNGGEHFAIKNYKRFSCMSKNTKLFHIDVENLYPNLMTNSSNLDFRFFPRSIGSFEMLKNMREKRAEYKKLAKIETDENKKKDYEKWSEALKRFNLMIYGSMGFNNSLFYDWENCLNVCLTGQLCITMLFNYLEKIQTLKLIQSNTDGVFVEFDKNKEIEVLQVCKNWEEKLKLKLEITDYSSGVFIQKDVNNYLITQDENNKKIKIKGTDLLGYERKEIWKKNDMNIIGICIVDFLLKNIPIEENIKKYIREKNYIVFQKIVKKNIAGDIYFGEKKQQKVIRAFFTKTGNNLTFRGGKLNNVKKVADTSNNCTLWNKNINDIQDGDINIDVDYYVKLIESKLYNFIKTNT